jgi:hypothetical protein
MTALLTETTRDLTSRLGEELKRQRGERLLRQVLRNLVCTADALAGITLSAWRWVSETLETEGFEGRELAGHCQVLLDAIDGSLAGYDNLLAIARTSNLTPEAAGLQDLESKIPALRAARPKVAETLHLATRAPRVVDEATLAASTAALESGKFVNVDDDYLARLRAGGNF